MCFSYTHGNLHLLPNLAAQPADCLFFFAFFRKDVSRFWYPLISGLRYPARPLVLPASHCKPLKRSITCCVASANPTLVSASKSWQNRTHTCRNRALPFALCSSKMSRCVASSNDHELTDVSFALPTVPLSCAIVYCRTSFLMMKHFLMLAHLYLGGCNR